MARTINHIERISESFDALDSMTQCDIIGELFCRLNPEAAAEARRRIETRAKLDAGRRQPSTPIPPMMDRAEVEQAGNLALEPAKGKVQ